MIKFKFVLRLVLFLMHAWKYFIGYIYARPMILFIAESLKKKGLVGVEIGVYKGDNAYFILTKLSIKKLFLIDPYQMHKEFKDSGWFQLNQSAFDKYFIQAQKKVRKFKNKVTFIKEKSEDAIRLIPSGLDFVYIDGNHEYEFVKKDIELYYPKLKKRGVLGGDNFESLYPGVARAVLEFTDKHNLKIHGAWSEASYEWWVIKK